MRLLPAFAVLLLAGCTAVPKPAPRPVPRPVPVTVVPPPPKPLASDWRDWPYTPGDWVYRQEARGSVASFGQAGTAPAFTIRCDMVARTIQLSRPGSVTAPMTFRTSSTLRTLTTQTGGGTPANVVVSLNARDGLLEAMLFSRGRFVIEQTGYPTLVLPSWAEIGRVTEDCRR